MSLIKRGTGLQISDKVMPGCFSVPITFREEPRVDTPPTLLQDSEIQLLYWLAKKIYRGTGEIVELGSWLGGSSIALACGLVENSSSYDKKIYVYDRFIWKESFQKLHSSCCRLKDNECFLKVYKDITQEYKSYLEVQKGDICQIKWTKGAIEILFIDIMKSIDSCKAVAVNFFPHLIPDISYIIHQDYKHSYTFWIHLLMYRLRDYFYPALNVADAGTTVFKLKKDISLEAIESALSFESFSLAELHSAFKYSSIISEGSDKNFSLEIIEAYDRALQFYLRSNTDINYETKKDEFPPEDNHSTIFQPILFKVIPNILNSGRRKVLVYGAGFLGQDFYQQAQSAGLEIAAFLESSPVPIKNAPNGLPPLLPEEGMAAYPDIDIVIASQAYANEMLHRLLESEHLAKRKIWLV